MSLQIPGDLFTLQSMVTLTGATGAVYVTCNSLQRAFNFNPRWLALLVAELISLFGTYVNAKYPSDYFVGVINGFLIYCTAVGAVQITASRTDSAAPMAPDSSGLKTAKRTLRSPWF